MIGRDARVEIDDLFKLVRETRQHELLFGPEIRDYINLLFKKGNELRARRQVRSTEHRGFDEETELLTWFSTQTQEAAALFHKYIDFTEP